jgi:predicted RNA-binding protein YlxR (DUF448 family)
VSAPAELVRIVARDGRAIVDADAVLPGRGAWLHPSPECLALADRRRAWGRALRVSTPVDVSAVQDFIRSQV